MILSGGVFGPMANGAESHSRCLRLVLTWPNYYQIEIKDVPGFERANEYMQHNPAPDYLTVEILWLRERFTKNP